MMVFSRDGGNGSYIEFEDGTYVDTVAGDSHYADGTIVPVSNLVSELTKWANENGLTWVDVAPATGATAAEIEAYVG